MKIFELSKKFLQKCSGSLRLVGGFVFNTLQLFDTGDLFNTGDFTVITIIALGACRFLNVFLVVVIADHIDATG